MLDADQTLVVGGDEMSMLVGITIVAGSLVVQADELDALGCLESAEGLTIEGSGTETLEALENLRAVETLGIFGCHNLHDLEGLESVELSEDLAVVSNPVLEDLSALQVPVELRSVTIGDNPSLMDFDGFQRLERLQRLELAFEGPAHLTGFASLAQVEQELSLRETKNLLDLAGATALESVGELRVSENVSLQSMAGTALREVQGDLTLEANANLASLEGLANVERVGGDLRISDNPMLLQCEAEAFEDQLVEHGGTTAVFGNKDGSCG